MGLGLLCITGCGPVYLVSLNSTAAVCEKSLFLYIHLNLNLRKYITYQEKSTVSRKFGVKGSF